MKPAGKPSRAGPPCAGPAPGRFPPERGVALGNWGSDEAVPVLASALSDSDPLVRGHAAWALGEVASPEAFDALESCGSSEDDPFVRSELEAALDRSRPKEK